MSRPVLVITNAWPDHADSYHGYSSGGWRWTWPSGWRSHVLVPRIYRESLPRERHERYTVSRVSPFFPPKNC